MTRKECLDKAAECVLKDRQNAYGKPEDCFGMIAGMWGAYLGVCVSAHDVAAMMALLKIARFRHNPSHEDNAVDCAGYAACMVECATAWEREGEDEAEGGCCQDGKHQPEFKPGDKVQARLSDEVWRDAVVTGKEITCGKLYYTVKIRDFSGYYSLQAGDVRPAPKEAEGCEELVQKDLHEDCEGCLYKTYADSHAEEHDAPQTKEELMERIASCNPAIFHGADE